MTRPRHMRGSYDEETRQRAIELRMRDGLSYTQVGKRTGLSKGQVGRILLNAGLTDPARALFPRSPKPKIERMPKPRRRIAAKPLKKGEHRCLWPQVDPKREGAQCEETAVPGKPYCLEHCRRAYQGFGG